MSSTRTRAQLQPSGFTLPPGGRQARWCAWFRSERNRHRWFRAGVFVVGLILLLAGAAMWLVSVLLAAPLVLAGSWVWSRDFHWGHRLFHGILDRLRSMWSRARARPVRWGLMTLAGVASAWAGSWGWQQYAPF